MSERDKKIKAIESFKDEHEWKIDKYDRHYYYLKIKERKRPALIVMELSHTGNGYINGRYVNKDGYETTKAGDINIKNFTDAEIIKLIKQAIQNIKKEFE